MIHKEKLRRFLTCSWVFFSFSTSRGLKIRLRLSLKVEKRPQLIEKGYCMSICWHWHCSIFTCHFYSRERAVEKEMQTSVKNLPEICKTAACRHAPRFDLCFSVCRDFLVVFAAHSPVCVHSRSRLLWTHKKAFKNKRRRKKWFC